jgi:hypothetical protein
MTVSLGGGGAGLRVVANVSAALGKLLVCPRGTTTPALRHLWEQLSGSSKSVL